MSAAGPASSNLRTYGKRSGTKRKQTKELLDPSQISAATGTTAKRQKLSPESRARTLSPTRTEENVDTDNEDTLSRNRRTIATYGSPRVRGSAPQSPSKPARDLSFIFDDIAPKSPSGSPSKLAKRMLSRSKTESSIESTVNSQPSAVDRTPSLPMFPSTPSRVLENIASTSKSVAPILPRLTQGSNKSITRTYAGKFRSFLVSLPKSSISNDALPTNMDDEALDTRESYSSLRSRWGVDNSEDDPYPLFSPSPSKSNKSNVTTPDMSPSRNGKGKGKAAAARPPPIPSGMMNPLKSISELRNRGESRRFLDEVGYLFEGMNKNGGIGLRRASALEITTKMCDADFTRKAKAADFFSRTWGVFLDAGAGLGEDKILDILLVFFVSLVARDPTSLSELAQGPSASSKSSISFKSKLDGVASQDLSLMSILFRLLAGTSPDIDPLLLVRSESSACDAEFKKAGIDKNDRPFLTTVYRTISSKANLFSPEIPISTSLLISYILQSLSPSTIQSKHFPAFLNSLRMTLSSSPSSSLSSVLSDKWHDAATIVPYDNVYYHILLLDTYLLDQWEPPPSNEGSQSQPLSQEDAECQERNDSELDRARDNWLAKDLIALCVCLELGGQFDDLESATLQRCLSTVLRVLVSLTHEDELWGRKVVQCEYTMGWLLRLIHRTGQEVLHNKTQVKPEEEVKVEETEEAPSLDQDGAAHAQADSYALDTLCLALGLLTNLIQIVDDAKVLLRNIRLNPSCTLKKQTCARKCNCTPISSGFEILARLYSQQQVKIETPSLPLSTDSPEARAEADASFLRSHLAVLFGLLMKGNSENQMVVLSALPSLSNTQNSKAAKRSKLTRLVEQAQDFAAFYTAVSRNLGGDKESKVAKDVVSFLEMQRDSIF